MTDPGKSLLTPTELARIGQNPNCVVVDCRFNLAQPGAGEAAYRAGHIPGAFYAHLDRDLSSPRTGVGGRHPLPEPTRLVTLLSGWGVGPDVLVVAYDDAGGAIAARLWWLLRWMGHPRAALLDGGLAAWSSAGLPLTTDIPQPRSVNFRGTPGQMPTIDAAEIEKRLSDTRLLILDARAKPRFLGREEPIDPVAGHIPGAVNLPFQANLAADGSFRLPGDLRAGFMALLGGRTMDNVAVMCGSGVTACQEIFALELAGISGARLYPGSWSDWISAGTRPVARE